MMFMQMASCQALLRITKCPVPNLDYNVLVVQLQATNE